MSHITVHWHTAHLSLVKAPLSTVPRKAASLLIWHEAT